MDTVVKRYIALDLETGGLESRHDPNVPVWCGVTCTESLEVKKYTRLDELILELDALLADDSVVFLIHNAAFDTPTLRIRGLNIPEGRYIDTLVLSHCFDSQGCLSLKDWAESGLVGGTKIHVDNDDWKHGLTPTMLERCVEDTVLTMNLFKYIRRNISQEQKNHYFGVSLPLVEAVVEMEATGLHIDLEATSSMFHKLRGECNGLLSEMKEMEPRLPGVTKTYKNGVYRNTGSHCTYDEFTPTPRNLAFILHRDGVECLVYPDSPQEITGERAEFLGVASYPIPSLKSEHAEGYIHPVMPKVQEYNKRAKLCSTFLSTWLEVATPDGYVRGSFNQTGTATGRLSSSNPNLQNIPARGELGSKLRGLVTAPNGECIVGGDLSNIEGRVLAYLLETKLGCKKLSDVFTSGGDFHASNAHSFGIVDFVRGKQPTWDEAKVLKVSRDIAKTALYAVIYGAGAGVVATGASRGSGMLLSLSDGERIMATMEKCFPEINALKEMTYAEAREGRGDVHTFTGRTLKYPALCYRNTALRSRAERQVFNACLQSPAGDILTLLLLGMLSLRDRYFVRARLACQVHDELLWYCPEDTAQDFADALTAYASENSYLGDIGNAMSFSIGKSWSEVK